MIEVVQGDILKADAEALVNTVNCVGLEGRGLAAYTVDLGFTIVGVAGHGGSDPERLDVSDEDFGCWNRPSD